MTERVAMPCYPGDYTKGFVQELVAKGNVFNKVLINGASLITCHPAPIDKFKSAISHQLPHLFLNVFGLVAPPSHEKPDLSVGETRLGIPPKIVCDISKNPIHSSVIIFQGSATPASILMRVSHNMESLLCYLLLQKLSLDTFCIRRECQAGTYSPQKHGE